uniref:Uncharacterized protein n=1 Tax=Glossina austeni TaxID=7395 RepID=A0A1A9VCJ3_GLOAU
MPITKQCIHQGSCEAANTLTSEVCEIAAAATTVTKVTTLTTPATIFMPAVVRAIHTCASSFSPSLTSSPLPSSVPSSIPLPPPTAYNLTSVSTSPTLAAVAVKAASLLPYRTLKMYCRRFLIVIGLVCLLHSCLLWNTAAASISNRDNFKVKHHETTSGQ